jgi:predicted nucleic acid-binding protein
VSYLLDTNIVSELRKPNANPNVRAWVAGTPAQDLYLSVLTLGELRHGIERLRRRDPAQARVLEQSFEQFERDFRDRLLPVTADIADQWGRLGVPDPIPMVDGLLAATARVHGFTLVTRNTPDFARTGVRLLNPFTAT